MSQENVRPRTIRYALQLLPQRDNHPWVPALSQYEIDQYLGADLFDTEVGSRPAMFVMPSASGYRKNKYPPSQTRMLLFFLDRPASMFYDHLAGNCDYYLIANQTEIEIHGDMVCEPSTVKWNPKNRWVNYRSEYVFAALIPLKQWQQLLTEVMNGYTLYIEQGRPPLVNRWTMRLLQGQPVRKSVCSFSAQDIFVISKGTTRRYASAEENLSVGSLIREGMTDGSHVASDDLDIPILDSGTSSGQYVFPDKTEADISVNPRLTQDDFASKTPAKEVVSSFSDQVSSAAEGVRDASDAISDLANELKTSASKLDKVFSLDD